MKAKKTKRPTIASMQAEIVKKDEIIANLRQRGKDLAEAIGFFLDDRYVGEDEAAEIAWDAVSERIW